MDEETAESMDASLWTFCARGTKKGEREQQIKSQTSTGFLFGIQSGQKSTKEGRGGFETAVAENRVARGLPEHGKGCGIEQQILEYLSWVSR